MIRAEFLYLDVGRRMEMTGDPIRFKEIQEEARKMVDSESVLDRERARYLIERGRDEIRKGN